MLKYGKQILAAAALSATFAAVPLARAGGVIIDGTIAKSQGAGSASTDTSSKEQNVSRKATEREQQVYLYVAAVLNGPVIYVEETGSTTPNPGTISALVNEIDGEESAGCAAAPSSMLAVLAGIALLWRRRH